VEKYVQLQRVVPDTRLLPDDLVWHALIAHQPAEILSPGGQPTVGFHSYGSQYRWPSNIEIFRSVYLAESVTYILFVHLHPAFKKFGIDVFRDIEVMESGEQSESKFLQSIDFWVYFPHHRLDDQVWEPVLRAMQAGKVIILPKRLERLYG